MFKARLDGALSNLILHFLFQKFLKNARYARLQDNVFHCLWNHTENLEIILQTVYINTLIIIIIIICEFRYETFDDFC